MGPFADLAASLIKEVSDLDFNQAREAYLKTSGLPFAEQLKLIFPGKDHVSLSQRFEKQKMESYLDYPVYPEALTILGSLREKGLKLAISSNNAQAFVEEYLAHHRALSDYIDLTLGYSDGFSKGVKHFDRALDHFNLEVREACYMGDSLHDGREAFKYGLDFVARLGTFQKEDFESQSIPVVAYDYEGAKEFLCKSFY